METIMFIIISIISVFGLTYIFNLLWLWFSKPKKATKDIVIIPINSTSESAEEILRYKLSLMSSKAERNSQIIIIDMGMNDDNREVCNIYEERYEFLKVMTPEQFSLYIEENF